MLVATTQLLQQARRGGYAVGAFNVYTLEGVRSVTAAAEALRSPAILQMLPRALALGGVPFVALCLEACRTAKVPMAVHLDHCVSEDTIGTALKAGVSSVMADGSHLDYAANLAFTGRVTENAHRQGAAVEAELGRLSGREDGLTVAAYEARLTDPDQAMDFVHRTGIDALAVCIGNLHGPYQQPPDLDFDRLAAIQRRLPIPLVLHGTSGLPDGMIQRAIALGVCKFNVNTELREACLQAAQAYLSTSAKMELVELMEAVIRAMQVPVLAKLRLFGSAGRAASFASDDTADAIHNNPRRRTP
jgi:tagatose 1,6-diphosphate aldolase GatY/KbaY